MDNLRRKTDTRPALPAEPVPYRTALANGLARIISGHATDPETLLRNAIDKLRRDEQTNAEIIDILVKAGYTDIPAQVDANLIRRLIGYISPGA